MDSTHPSYGVIDRYLGAQGEDYFARQVEIGKDVRYNEHIWAPHMTATDEVLDFGCGTGFLLNMLNVNRKVGVEINPHARTHAREQLGLEVYETLDAVPGTFTKVISSHALEHVPHPHEAVTGLRAKLRDPDSRLLLLLPLDDWRNAGQRHYDPADPNMHLHTWTPQHMGNLLQSCGLRVLDVRVIHHAWPPKRDLLWNVSPTLFHLAARCWAVLKKQRQLFAIAALPPDYNAAS